MTTRARVGALLLEHPELGEPDRRQHAVGSDRHPRPAGGPRRGPVDSLLERRQPRLVGADLADDARPDPRSGDAILELPDELVGQVVDRVRRSIRASAG